LLYHRHSCSHRCWSLARTVAGASLARIRIIAGASHGRWSLARTDSHRCWSLACSERPDADADLDTFRGEPNLHTLSVVGESLQRLEISEEPEADEQRRSTTVPGTCCPHDSESSDHHFFVDEELNTLVVDDETLTENHTSRHRR